MRELMHIDSHGVLHRCSLQFTGVSSTLPAPERLCCDILEHFARNGMYGLTSERSLRRDLIVRRIAHVFRGRGSDNRAEIEWLRKRLFQTVKNCVPG